MVNNKGKSALSDASINENSITREAEENVISVLLTQAEIVDDVLSIVDVNDFYYIPTKTIFQAIKELHDENSGIDTLSVWEKLQRDGKLKLIGGELALNHYSDKSIDSLIDPIQDAKILKKKANQKRIRDFAKRVMERATKDEPKEVLAEIDNAIMTLEPSIDDDIKFGLIHRKGELLEKHNKPKKFIQSTIFGGFKFKAGDVVLLKGKTGHGKTGVALNVTADLLLGAGVSNEPLSVLYFAYEQQDDEIIEMIASIMGISYEKLIETKGEYLDVLYGKNKLTDIEAHVRTATRQRKKPLDLVVVDYDTYLEPAGRYDNEERRVNAISKGLKRMAVKYETTVLLLSQVNDDGKAKWGRVKEEDASVVIDLEMTEEQEEALLDKSKSEWSVTPHVVKSRNGAFGKETLTFDRETRALRRENDVEGKFVR